MTVRGPYGTIRDILRAVADGEDKPTRIMHRANLTWKTLNKYLDKLQASEIVACNEHATSTKKSRRYRITEKGLRCYDLFAQLDELIGG